MRGIKFRAWDNQENIMISAEDFAFEEYMPLSDLFKDRHYDFMQYTGFHDKNGKEIYEGDILADFCGEIFEVKWHTFSGSWELGGKERHFLFWMIEIKTFEVIGNIYENPELLKAGGRE